MASYTVTDPRYSELRDSTYSGKSCRRSERSRSRERSPNRERHGSRARREDSLSPERSGRHHRREKSRERERSRERPRSKDRYGHHDRIPKDDRTDRRSTRDEDGGRRKRSRSPSDRRRRSSSPSDRRKQSGGSEGKERRRDSRGSESSPRKEKPESDREVEPMDDSAIDIFVDPEAEAARLKEESRRRRQAILEKFKTSGESGAPQLKDTALAAPSQGHARFEPLNGMNAVSSVAIGSAAEHAGAIPGSVAQTISGDQVPANDMFATEDVAKAEPAGKVAESPDMFADDMFGDSPAAGRRMGAVDGAVRGTGLNDNWDDAEGYYTFRIGEVLDGRYEVASTHGRGVFSTVVRAVDLKENKHEVAIKIIRNNETMFKAGQQEMVILHKLAGADPDDRRHCVRLMSDFQYRGHLCLVFESLQMNLREVLKKFGRNIGISLKAVRAYAMQLFLALKHLRNCGILHCDIKPDNMLVNESKNVLKLADFGSAMFSGDNEITPYLVSRFYRAPEIMLGLPYDYPLDMWSVGCCLYELYTGKMLFPGRNNNDMLRLHIELKGPFPKKLLKKASFVDQHFDSDLNFCALEDDPVTKKPIKRVMANVKPKDFVSLLPSTSDDDHKFLAAFRDLLEKMFALDPDKRITVSQALNHPFILGK